MEICPQSLNCLFNEHSLTLFILQETEVTTRMSVASDLCHVPLEDSLVEHLDIEMWKIIRQSALIIVVRTVKRVRCLHARASGRMTIVIE